MSNILSDKIKIFPVAKDRTEAAADPQATLFTEANMTTWLHSVVDKEAFIVSGTVKLDSGNWVVGNEDLVLYVKGYVIRLDASVSTNSTVLCKNSSTNTLYVSLNYVETELDQDDGNIYKGVTFSSEFSETNHKVAELKDGEIIQSRYKLDNRSIERNWEEELEIIQISCLH